MATILMLDRSLVFGPDTVDREPLGGSESAFTWLARALARRGHRVHVRTLCSQAHDDGHLEWAPFETPPPARSDMVIANRRWYLFPPPPRRADASCGSTTRPTACGGLAGERRSRGSARPS
jgi:hypothetical protein